MVESGGGLANEFGASFGLMKMDILEQVKQAALLGQGCDKSTALQLLEQASLAELCKAATEVREKFFGNKVRLCMIINAKSGVCDMDCTFCSQSGHNKADAPVYPFLESDKLADRFRQIDGNQAHNCGVVTSGGRLSGDDIDKFIAAVDAVRGNVSFGVCGSLGRLSDTDLARLKAAGIDRYHHNLESSEGYYPSICTTQQWQSRLGTVKAAIAMGMKVCSGGLFGLGESWGDRIDLALALDELDVDSIPINFLYPHAGTPLGSSQLLLADDALRIIAIYRLILPDKTLRICGGRAAVLGERQCEIFAAGANALMTGDYLTTSGQVPDSDRRMIESLGLIIE